MHSSVAHNSSSLLVPTLDECKHFCHLPLLELQFPNCGQGKFKEKTWPCEICLEASKIEAIKLIDMLTEDFGFSSNDLTVAFSGHRGYHVHVESKLVRELDSSLSPPSNNNY